MILKILYFCRSNDQENDCMVSVEFDIDIHNSIFNILINVIFRLVMRTIKFLLF